MRAWNRLLPLVVAISLSGCLTQQDTATFTSAMLDSAAQGIISGAAANLGQGIAMKNSRMVKVGAAALAAGSVAKGISAATAPRNVAGIPAATGPAAGSATGFGVPGSGMNYPDTPQCRTMWQFIHSGLQTQLAMRGGAYYRRLMQLEHNCLASAPDHPMSKSRACGGGRYLHYLGPPVRGYCGWQTAVAAYNSK